MTVTLRVKIYAWMTVSQVALVSARSHAEQRANYRYVGLEDSCVEESKRFFQAAEDAATVAADMARNFNLWDEFHEHFARMRIARNAFKNLFPWAVDNA